MSTYVFSKNQNFEDCPELVRTYLKYLLTHKDRSPRTVNAYYIDLRLLLKYIVQYRAGTLSDVIDDECDITHLDIDFFKSVTRSEVFDFLYFVLENRKNSVATRARKLSSFKGFFKYLTVSEGKLTHNPLKDIESAKPKKKIPKYLTLEESKELLNVASHKGEREFCMLTLFLNCGMRLSELRDINISTISEDRIKVIGKGRKERFVYINGSCKDAIEKYLAKRAQIEKIIDSDALFLSDRTGKRLSARRLQQIVENAIKTAGLGDKGISVHKLRHTAATLLYQHGGADMLALKEILGHEHVSTTEIYTHISDEQLKKAATSSPLANFKAEEE